MELKFEELAYQTDAVNAVVRLFEGQHRESFSLHDAGIELFVGNKLDLDWAQIGENLNNVQKTFGQPETEIGQHGLNFSVEMETGTGKTYVYLRTIFELNRQYGWTKFVIVVPGVPIREGVLQTLRATKNHFAELFNKPVMNFGEYDSKRLGALRAFAVNDGIEIMVINIQSFEKDGNVINQVNESGDAPIHWIQQTRPIVIVDEPQNMETENRLAALDSFNPLFILRYSATHKNSRHKVYSLNPVEAYNQKLVKQIVVQSVLAENDSNGAFVELLEIQAGKGSLKAKLNIHYRDKKETKKKAVTVKSGDDLFDKSGGVEAYRHGYIVNGLDAEDEIVAFSNGLQISRADNQDALQDEVMKAQIRCTIIDLAAEKINRCLHALMSEGIVYELTDNEQYRQELLCNLQKMENEGEEFYFDERTTFTVRNGQKTIAENYIPLDSETEQKFAVDCENYENVSLYFKLPRWFKIPTPLGNYNPDWAVVKQNGGKAYFVAETKNTGKGVQEGVDRSLLREGERLKIECAERFFRQIPEVRYRDVVELKELET
ncbi:DEAD/DEAH box helicase family protein [Neisseria bacilliformis]|uniref:restriction endonuclease n=1 Tax=Neisseria bacilliformis TaxID=267212 RepID=UPI00066695FD|nr:DEAD/DEAH box helicase family protein [Neisseria bacilliformis]